MKKILVAIALMISVGLMTTAQVTRSGNTFKQTTSSSQFAKSDTLVTSFTYEDSKGIKYPIIINKNSGSCYVIRTSKKTGKQYRQYLGAEISMQICKELHIEYKSKNSK